MIKFINKATGGITLVEEGRAEEYIKAGYKLVAPKRKTSPRKKGGAKK